MSLLISAGDYPEKYLYMDVAFGMGVLGEIPARSRPSNRIKPADVDALLAGREGRGKRITNSTRSAENAMLAEKRLETPLGEHREGGRRQLRDTRRTASDTRAAVSPRRTTRGARTKIQADRRHYEIARRIRRFDGGEILRHRPRHALRARENTPPRRTREKDLARRRLPSVQNRGAT